MCVCVCIYIYIYTHTHNRILLSHQKELMPFAATQMVLEILIISQRKTNI